MAGGGGGLGGGRNLGSIRQPGFLLEALDKSQSKRDGGFKNNWSFDHSEESEGDTEKDEANLLTFDESDGTCSPNGERKPCHHRLVGFGARNDALRTYSRRNKSDTPGTLKSMPTGLNISGSSKKIWCSAFQMISKLFNIWCISGGNVSNESAPNNVQLSVSTLLMYFKQV